MELYSNIGVICEKFLTKVLVLESTLIGVYCIESPNIYCQFLSSGKLRVTTPFFDRGTF